MEVKKKKSSFKDINKPKKKRATRKDNLKNKAKITKVILKDPLKTQREIAKESKTWLWTVNRSLKELEHTGTKDPRILGICDTDIEIVQSSNEVRLWFVLDAVRKRRTYILLQNFEYDKAYEEHLISTDTYNTLTSGDETKAMDILKGYKLNAKEIQLIDKMSETSQKRYSIFMGDATDDKWWLNAPILELDTDILLEKLRKLNEKKQK